MIAKELAQEKLKTFYNMNSVKEQVARLQKLSAQVSRTGQILIQAGPEWDKLKKSQAQSFGIYLTAFPIRPAMCAGLFAIPGMLAWKPELHGLGVSLVLSLDMKTRP
jgi:hypothetical protein